MDKPVPPIEERRLGLELYLTSSPPLGGKLKKRPEDFIVNEISRPPPDDPTGDYQIARIKVYNWETNRLIRALSKKLGISRRAIGFAGTKDKRALTTQLFSFKMSEDKLRDLDLKDVFVLDSYRSNRDLDLGDLHGNNFRITIKDIGKTGEEIEGIMKADMEEVVRINGYPNYFGIQRFGTVRPITHTVGLEILKGNYEEAVLTYIGNPYPMEREDAREARERIEKDLDFKEALDYYPSFYLFERSIIHHLHKNEGDWKGAIDQLPLNLKMMFIHAYQSYVFNKILSERMRREIPIDRPIPGDIVLTLDKNSLPDRHNYIRVNKNNLVNITELCEKKKAYVSAVLPGNESEFASGEMGAIERKISSKDDIIPDNYDINEIRGIKSKGIRREIKSTVFDLKWRLKENIAGVEKKSDYCGWDVEMDFSLYRGCYATTFLREIMKSNILDY